MKETVETPKPVHFFYHNLSHFHGNGEVVWVGENGHAVVQIASKEKAAAGPTGSVAPATVERRYELSIADEPVLSSLKQLSATEASDLKIIDRLGNPDEVRVRFGFRDQTGKFHSLDLWEADWNKQPEAVQKFRQAFAQIIELAKRQKPSLEQTDPESFEFWPSHFAPLEPAPAD